VEKVILKVQNNKYILWSYFLIILLTAIANKEALATNNLEVDVVSSDQIRLLGSPQIIRKDGIDTLFYELIVNVNLFDTLKRMELVLDSSSQPPYVLTYRKRELKKMRVSLSKLGKDKNGLFTREINKTSAAILFEIDVGNILGKELNITHKLQTDEGSTLVMKDLIVAYNKPLVIGSPVRGKGWYVTSGNSFQSHHHRFISSISAQKYTVSQKYAVDLYKIDPGWLTSFFGFWGIRIFPEYSSNVETPAFGEEVISVADGVVVSVKTGMRDHEKRMMSPITEHTEESITGNCVVIKIDNNIYAYYAHLQQDTITVKEGDHIMKGAVVGQVGNTGSSQVPHLHFQLSNSDISILRGNGIPYVFEAYESKGVDFKRSALSSSHSANF
jgi:Peptidase family M23